MIDSRVSNLVMPKCVVDLLGIKYEPMGKGVIQLDGSSIQIVRLWKDIKLTLYECFSCVVI